MDIHNDNYKNDNDYNCIVINNDNTLLRTSIIIITKQCKYKADYII